MLDAKTIGAFGLGLLVAAGGFVLLRSPEKAEAPAPQVIAAVEPAVKVLEPEALPDSKPVVEAPSEQPKPSKRWRQAAAPVAKAPSVPANPSPVPATNSQPAPAAAPVKEDPAPVATPEPARAPDIIQPPAKLPPPPRKPRSATIPGGTLLTVRLAEALTASGNTAGYEFRATLDQPLVVNGMVVAERGSTQLGRVLAADPAGRVKGRAALTLQLVELATADGQKIEIQTEPFVHQADSSVKSDVAKAGAGAAIGAAIGAIAGGGKGAGIGAAIGGAAGAGTVLATRGKDARLDEETRISFRLKDSVTLTEKID